ncbi:MAG: hypothetical protein ABSD72_14320 [Terracidiphilus sp.]|jgi:hypothetical protein
MKKVVWIALIVVLLGAVGVFVAYRISMRAMSEQPQPLPAVQSPPSLQTTQTQSQAAPQEGSFDEPLRKVVVDLGVSEYSAGNNPEHSEVRCNFYPGFVVKELDLKQEGDEWISIAPISASNPPPCTQENSGNEIVIKPQDWSGYFAGVKGNFVFLNAEDGFNGGYPFGIFDASTGKKLFEDSRESGKEEKLRFVSDGRGLVLRYQRIDVAECSIPEKKGECWEQIMRKAGLNSQPLPVCSGYGGNIDETANSVVSYAVEVSLLPGFERRLLSGPIHCWPGD